MTVMSSVLILVGVLAGLAAGLLIGRYVSGRESAAALAQTQTDSTAREAKALQAASDTATQLARAEGELAEARAERDALRLQQAEAHTRGGSEEVHGRICKPLRC